VPVWDIHKAVNASTDMLVRTPDLGKALAKALGAHPAALMRGHGAVVVGRDVQQAVFRSVYTELNARLQSQAMALGSKVIYLDAAAAKKSEETNSALVGRSWDLWVRKVRDKGPRGRPPGGPGPPWPTGRGNDRRDGFLPPD